MGFGSPFHWFVIAIILLLLFGNRLPSVMRSLGQGVVEFKKGLQGIEDDIKNSTNKIEEQPTSRRRRKRRSRARSSLPKSRGGSMHPVFAFLDNPVTMLVLGALAVLLFGERLPEVARSIGKGLMEVKKGSRAFSRRSRAPSTLPRRWTRLLLLPTRSRKTAKRRRRRSSAAPFPVKCLL